MDLSLNVRALISQRLIPQSYGRRGESRQWKYAQTRR